MKQVISRLCVFLAAILLTGTMPVCSQTTVALDNWFNHEIHAKTGNVFHYTWEDTLDSGFSQLGDLFTLQGARLLTLAGPPTKKSLKNAGVYIIVDPDTTRENPSPNYVTDKDVRTIFRWVKKGGVLLLMSNDGPNAEFTHFNRLAGAFGFTFHPLTLNPVTGRNWEMGAETNFPDHPLFKGVSKIYMKEVAPITLAGKASSVLKNDDGSIFIAETNFGKGYVMAVGDPWLYNEYIGHSRLTVDFENGKAANNLVKLLLGKVKNKHTD
ncbi:MAG: DUF4350 domain-containing protein [Prolixibacteraceae bacterium]|jgi:unsaturated rhamnogalacturonyl hydrolase|nr:hypothetical protein [Prolixibacteraceae bacterium]MDI9565112.1 hypothetical protein [Bacteroidota bacterium]HNU78781.1 hypothetical protein [Prolixibacteraceae bacterium]HOF56405.1 hypothetical protein [Prolixibacteraceae bacterium]HOS00916.1 hypothetical protein [Prolixibacteraceae bacterium]